MKITSLKTQHKDPNRVSVFIDGKFHCGLHLSQIAELGVKQGEIEPSYARKLKEHSNLGKLHMQTIDWLLRRPRSRRELNDYFFRKKITDDEKKYVLNKVEAYLDDRLFAQFWIDGRRGVKHKSSRVIKGELQQKGVAVEVIDELLEQHESTDQDMLAKVIMKKQRQTKYQDKQKLTEYLLRQGFRYDDIKSALEDE